MTPSEVVLVGAPWCEGQNLEGADLAPVALREAGLEDAVASLGLRWQDHGDVRLDDLKSGDHYSACEYREWLASGSIHNFSTWVRRNSEGKRDLTSLRRKRTHEMLVSETKTVNVVNAALMGAGLQRIHEAISSVLAGTHQPKPFVLTVGGDHSIAAGSISALLDRYPSLGVIWVDAHADANTPRSSPSGHYHGMPAAHLLGWFDQPGELGEGVEPGALQGFDWFRSGCLPENKLAYIGLRDVDKEEGKLLRKSGVRVYTMREVDKFGIARVIEMAIEAVGPAMDCPLHLSLDIDGVDPHFAPGTGTAARGGLSYREIHYICEELALSKRLVSMDLVEVNPGIDPPPTLADQSESGEANDDGGVTGSAMHGDHPAIRGASPTVRLAIELVLSALGKQIC